MRVASNKLIDLRDFYRKELKLLYPETEADALFYYACEHFLGYNRQKLIAGLTETINQSDLLKIYDCGKALSSGKPIQYILNEAWFFNRRFYVNPSVLIPRPETEELVELILPVLPAGGTVLDIGTGSGCIPITLACEKPSLQVSGCDVSKPALLVARQNATQLNIPLHVIEADVLSSGFLSLFKHRFDCLISNPPYIVKQEAEAMHSNVLQHEPHLALFVEGDDAVLFYRIIIAHSAALLNPHGLLAFELNPLTAEMVKQLATDSKLFTSVEIKNDMSGKQRFLLARKINN